MEKENKCVICGEEMTDIRKTCNAHPVREGRCCIFCDNMLVTPYRMTLAGMKSHDLLLNLVTALQENKDLYIKITLQDSKA